MIKYSVGTKVICNNIQGVIVGNYKLPGDICIHWETGCSGSYDVWWLDENVEVVQEQG